MFDAIHLRPRSPAEATDLGLAITREHWPALVSLALLCMLPVAALAIGASLITPTAGIIVAWLLKPSLDRPLLHLMSRRVAGIPTGVRQSLREVGQWWRGGHMALLSIYRLHPDRSAVLPVWQLERLSGQTRRQRSAALSHGGGSQGALLILAASTIELIMVTSVLMLAIWVAPSDLEPALPNMTQMELGMIPDALWYWLLGAYLVVIVLVEPFYQGAGFGQYLNQRCRLECWDLEPAFRRLAQRSSNAGPGV